MPVTPLFRTLIADDLLVVDRVIRASLHSDVALIRQVSEYIISAGGKRLRPALTLLAGRACNIQSHALYSLAAMVECIHTATLLHDDVVDESDLRRGRQTANALFGNAASVLVGDFLYTRAFQMMVSTDNMRILQVMADATNIIAEGEVLQLLNIGDANVSEKAYLQVIEYKTAKLFEAACRISAILANSDQATEPTLPLMYVMQHGNAEQAACVRQAITEASRDHFQSVLTAVQSSGALTYARHVAVAAAQQAIAAISILPDTAARHAMIALAEFSVDRES